MEKSTLRRQILLVLKYHTFEAYKKPEEEKMFHKPQADQIERPSSNPGCIICRKIFCYTHQTEG